MIQRILFAVTVLACFVCCPLSLEAADPPEALPSVLMVGDAVTQQYVEPVRTLLKGHATVAYMPTPTGAEHDTKRFVEQVLEARKQHRVIYFSYGLDVARKRDAEGKPAAKGKPALTPLQYKHFLNDLYAGLRKQRNKRMIWATSVPVPKDLVGFSKNHLEYYNNLATDAAYNKDTMVLDVYEYVRIRGAEMQQPGGYMLSETGADLIASVAANKIQEMLGEGDNPELPNVLVLGDSIVNQYSTFLREGLIGKANVRIGGTAFGANPDWALMVRNNITLVEQRTGRPFDVIHFNWGLHALKWVDENNKLTTEEAGGVRCVPIDRYDDELEKLVVELKKTGRMLVWGSTTPWNDGRDPDDAAVYNAVALKVMRRHGIEVNDLYGFVMREGFLPPKSGCHYRLPGAKRLGERVADKLARVLHDNLPKPPIAPGKTRPQAETK